MDMGIGIFNSLNGRVERFAASFAKFLGIEHNKDKMRQIIDGELEIPTSTGERKRGK